MRHRQREQAGGVGAALESPDRLNQRRRVVTGLPIGCDGGELRLDFGVAHGIGRAAARRRVRQTMLAAVGGRQLDLGGDSVRLEKLPKYRVWF